jgi:hypothetical protein
MPICQVHVWLCFPAPIPEDVMTRVSGSSTVATPRIFASEKDLTDQNRLRSTIGCNAVIGQWADLELVIVGQDQDGNSPAGYQRHRKLAEPVARVVSRNQHVSDSQILGIWRTSNTLRSRKLRPLTSRPRKTSADSVSPSISFRLCRLSFHSYECFPCPDWT